MGREAPAAAVRDRLRRNSLRVKCLFFRCSIVIFSRTTRWGLGLYGFKFWVVRVVAAGAKIISPLPRTRKISHPFPMEACSPVLVLGPMAFSAESITFCEVDQVPVIEPQLIPIARIVAVEAPPHRFSVMEFDVGVLFLQLPLLPIDLHRGMAVATGIHSLGHRRRRVFFNDG